VKYYLKTAITISQGSVATGLRCVGIILRATLLRVWPTAEWESGEIF